PPPPPPPPPDPAVADAERRRWTARARAIWLGAQPSLRDTPAAAYLAGRGIDLASLGRQPRSLRYHSAVVTDGRPWPAMVACIIATTGGERGRIIGVHRTFLARSGGMGGDAEAWAKAPLERPKRILGSLLGGIIPLWRG
ncbi:MAG TPA: hypothetical protein VES39_02500, partial [Rhodospirillales bacterium]|nr:hypothetical protein [Rhodospirillales bacterium]